MKNPHSPSLSSVDKQSPAYPLQNLNSAAPLAADGDNEPRAAMGGADSVITQNLDESSPRLVTRGESIYTPPPQYNPKAALIDWLNFTFPFELDAKSLIEKVTASCSMSCMKA